VAVQRNFVDNDVSILIQDAKYPFYFSSIYNVDTLWMLTLKYKIFLPVLVSLTYWVYVACSGVNKLNRTIDLFTVGLICLECS